MTKDKPKFYVLHKDFNTGKVEKYDVLKNFFYGILTDKGEIKKKEFVVLEHNIKDYFSPYKLIPVRTKEHLKKFIESEFHSTYWGRCEWEFVAIDWPHGDNIDNSRPVKIDVYQQLKPNIPVITDLVWNYLEPKIQKLIDKENKKDEKIVRE